MEIQDLVETGLTKNQARVYLEVFKYPGQTGGNIAKRTALDRSFVYNILDALVTKGLVSHIVKGKLRSFYPTDPKNLLRELDEKRTKFDKVINELESIKAQSKIENIVRVYEGNARLKVYILDLLNAKTFSTLGGGGKLKILDVLKYDYPHYLKKFETKKISGRLITSAENKKTMRPIYQKIGGKIKVLDGLQNDVSLTIFNEKVAIYSAEEKPFVVIIENRKVTNALQSYFEKLWKTAR